MPAEYAVGHGKPPVSGQFRKGQSGNPGGRPGIKKIRRRKFAQMLDAAMCESTELVAMPPCASNYAASAKGMALDCVRGKTATLRLMLSLLDDLDHVATDGRQRRGFDRRLEEMEAADEAAATFENEQESNGSVRPVSQGVIEEERLPVWDELARETPGRSTAASPLSEGIKQGTKAESERSFLAVARRVPSEKELREQEKQAGIACSRKAYEEAVAHVKAFAATRLRVSGIAMRRP